MAVKVIRFLQQAGKGPEVVLDQSDEPIQKLPDLPETLGSIWRLPLEGMRPSKAAPGARGDSHRCDFRLFHATDVKGACGIMSAGRVELLRVSQLTLMSDSDSLTVIQLH